jgi:putative ABC transport system permease protein
VTAFFHIAWKYISYYRLRSAILVACVSLIAVLPLSLQLLLDESESQLLSRATTTPLVLGAKGSALDLVMNTLYFDDEVPGTVSAEAADTVTQSGLALGVPVYARFRARSYPVVGTTLDYFDFRNLAMASGRPLALLGEAVIGASVAAELGLDPGDSLVSTPETVFDLAGIYPLKMQVVGVLERSHSPDDLAVFVDIRTAWIIAGLGHGHEDLARARDKSVIMEATGDAVVASPKLLQYTEITDANRASFHFHGATDSYPLTAVLVVPDDARAGTILRGRYLDAAADYQVVKPDTVIDGLLQNIFRIKTVIDGVIVIVGLATGLAVLLVFLLSMRLRQREIETITRIGCSRFAVLQLLVAEILIVIILSGLIVTATVACVDTYASDLVRLLIIN